MTKKEINKLKKAIENVSDINEMRSICQEFNDLIGGPHNFKFLHDQYVIVAFNQIKEVVMCLK